MRHAPLLLNSSAQHQSASQTILRCPLYPMNTVLTDHRWAPSSSLESGGTCHFLPRDAATAMPLLHNDGTLTKSPRDRLLQGSYGGPELSHPSGGNEPSAFSTTYKQHHRERRRRIATQKERHARETRAASQMGTPWWRHRADKKQQTPERARARTSRHDKRIQQKEAIHRHDHRGARELRARKRKQQLSHGGIATSRDTATRPAAGQLAGSRSDKGEARGGAPAGQRPRNARTRRRRSVYRMV